MQEEILKRKKKKQQNRNLCWKNWIKINKEDIELQIYSTAPMSEYSGIRAAIVQLVLFNDYFVDFCKMNLGFVNNFSKAANTIAVKFLIVTY